VDVMQSMAVFRRVAEAGSFSAVARETDMSQSSVSKHVAALEERLATKLLNRSTRQLSLTDAGTEYYHYCVRILNDFQEAEASVGKGKIVPTGTLRISSNAAFGRIFVMPFLNNFLQKYPDINIDYLMQDHFIDLVKEGIDLAIHVGPLSDSSLIAHKIGSCSRVVVASPQYLLKHGFPKKPADLESHACLLYSQQKSPREWFFTSTQHGDESVHVHGRIIASSNDALLEAALNGLGIARLCDWQVMEYIRRGRLTVLLQKFRLTAYDINAIYPERRFVPQKVKRLIEDLKENFAQLEIKKDP
jgi:DNA-binding transcriptional LysR family regulator